MYTTEIHKDLTSYRAKVVAGLTARSLFFSIAAVAVGVLVGAYLTWVLGFDLDDVSSLVYAATIPFWALGFWEPLGMMPEKWLPLYLRHRTAAASKISYGTARRMERAFGRDPLEKGLNRVHTSYASFRRIRGIERHRPGQGV